MTVTDAALLLFVLAIMAALAWYFVSKGSGRGEPTGGGPGAEGRDGPVFRVKKVATGSPRLLIQPPTPPLTGTTKIIPVMKKTVKVNPSAPCRVTGKPKTLCRHCQENEAHGDDL